MKSKDELNALKQEVAALNAKLAELSEDELGTVIGGIDRVLVKQPVPNVANGVTAHGPKPDFGVSITASSREMSNVDIAQEFSDMIKAQRTFNANSRVITTSDEMLDKVLNK